jgi:hypothetical protein
VGYHIEILDRDAAHLEGLREFSREGIIRIFEGYERDLSRASDQFREERRLSPGSLYFRYDLLLRGLDRTYQVRFFVDDSHAAVGVLRIVYVDVLPTALESGAAKS